jgi:hypothetical protein
MKSAFAFVILFAGSMFVGVIWLVSLLCIQKAPFDVGALESLFTGLAFVAVIATFTYQHQESVTRANEMLTVLRGLERSTAALEDQAKTGQQSRYLNALVARIEGYSIQFGIYGRTAGLTAEQNRLLYELHDALSKSRGETGIVEVTQAEVDRREGRQTG